ncbi:MAG TPA: beta-ketoacyl-ACP synthase 3 [Solirubrobacterales bacterium]|nr:beta-ketoacyl-ACP synthase 3 [Solirubrobacterales bacterium]
MPELPQDFEVDASLVDPEGLVARATGARTNGQPTNSPGIASIAAAVPDRVVENDEIAAPLGIDSDWIASRTGVRRRRRVSGETLVDLSAGAGVRALELARMDPSELDFVLVATFTPDELLPNAAPQVAARVGASGAAAIDVGAACTGFLSALSLARAQIEAGSARAALVVGAEVISRVIDYDDRRTAGLFGDGAGAAVLAPGGPGGIGQIALRSDARGAELIKASNEERLIRMDGRATFRAAVAAMSDVTMEVLSDEGLALDEIDLFVYHQANSRIIGAVGERLGLPGDRVIDCIAEYGNTSAASIPIALSEAAAEGRLRPGSKLLLCAFGAGFTWGAGIVDWEGTA